MAKLQPNTTYELLGVKINEKIIPDGTKWKDAKKAQENGFCFGSLYKKQKKLSDDSGIPCFVTIHNTADIDNVEDDAEQYTRATYNENMGTVRVHFYVDDLGAWQNLKAGTGMCKNDPENSAEVSWHSGDGSVSDGGNMSSISIEIIMNDNYEHDNKAKDNGARIAAWLLVKHGLTIQRLVTHTYWVNKSKGKKLKDVDEQCTTMIPGHKWCPAYIFNSTKHSVALENWKAFKSLVQKYMDGLLKSEATPQLEYSQKTYELSEIQIGDLVSISRDAVYYTGKQIPLWVKERKWYVSKCNNDRIVIDNDEYHTTSICSPINKKYLKVVARSISIFQPYCVKITDENHEIHSGPGQQYSIVGFIKDRGVYTIVEERTDSTKSSAWGKLKSGAGWISLEETCRR